MICPACVSWECENFTLRGIGWANDGWSDTFNALAILMHQKGKNLLTGSCCWEPRPCAKGPQSGHFCRTEGNGTHLEYTSQQTASLQTGNEEQQEGGRQMMDRKPPTSMEYEDERQETESFELLQEAFVCISIPVAVFALVYISLQTIVGIFLN